MYLLTRSSRFIDLLLAKFIIAKVVAITLVTDATSYFVSFNIGIPYTSEEYVRCP